MRARSPEEEEARRRRHAAWEAEEAKDVADWSRRRREKAEKEAGAHRAAGRQMVRSSYHVLGLPDGADFDTVKLAYRKLALQYHPDLNAGDVETTKKMAEINSAFSNIQTAHLKSLIKEIVSQHLKAREQ
jgi:DnaJ-domain-containing protein 1